MNLPVSTMVAITIIVIAIVALVAFFYTSGGGAASRAEMQSRFTEGCLVLCAFDQKNDITAVRLAYGGYDTWQSTCEQLYGIPRGAYMQCLTQCTCASLPSPCERLQLAANSIAADCPFVCGLVQTNDATKLLYKDCQCTCK